MAKKKGVSNRVKSENSKPFGLLRRILLTILILAIVGAAIFFIVLQRNGDQVNLPENAIGSIITPIQNALSTAAHGVKNFFTNWHNYGKLQDEYDALSEENMRLKLELNDAQEALNEYPRLTKLDDAASSSYDTLDPIYAKVIARDAGQWFFTFTVNRGSVSGVSVGMAVVNGDGLIGRVTKVGMNYAEVMSIIDSRSGVACLVQRTRDNCVLRGSVSENDDEARCMAYYLPNLNNIVPGDTLITSGTDSVYPKGLIVGTVTELSLTAGDDGNYAVVSPAVDFLHIEEVMILRTVVESADSEHAVLLTPTPAPTSTPAPEATATPDPDSDYWTWPTNVETQDNGLLNSLPEDAWVESED